MNVEKNIIVFELIVSSKKLYLQYVKRVDIMILNCFRIVCIINRLHSSCYWFSNFFSLYDEFEIWSFDMIIRINCFIKWIAFTKFSKTSRYRWLFESNVSLKNLHLSCYWFSNIFSLYDLIVICFFFRNCFLSMFCKLIREF